LVSTLRAARLEPKRMRFVHPRRELPASSVLIEARANGGVEVTIEPPLVLEARPGVYTDEVRELLQRGWERRPPATRATAESSSRAEVDIFTHCPSGGLLQKINRQPRYQCGFFHRQEMAGVRYVHDAPGFALARDAGRQHGAE